MKKTLSLIFVFMIFFFGLPAFSKKKKPAVEKTYPEVSAPAVQFELQDYKVKLKSRSDYIVTCESEVIGLKWGDVENIALFDSKDPITDKNDLKSFIIKTKFQTYSYIRIYKYNGEIVNVIVSVNPIFSENTKENLGLCELLPYTRPNIKEENDTADKIKEPNTNPNTQEENENHSEIAGKNSKGGING